MERMIIQNNMQSVISAYRDFAPITGTRIKPSQLFAFAAATSLDWWSDSRVWIVRVRV